LECALSQSGVAVELARCEEAGTSRPPSSEKCTPKQCTEGLAEYAPVRSQVNETSKTLPAGWTAWMVLCTFLLWPLG
jgi:hypothetical protein